VLRHRSSWRPSRDVGDGEHRHRDGDPGPADTCCRTRTSRCTRRRPGKDGYALFESAMHTSRKTGLELDIGPRERAWANSSSSSTTVLNLEDERVVGVERCSPAASTRGVIPPDVFHSPIARGQRADRLDRRWVARAGLRAGRRPGTTRDTAWTSRSTSPSASSSARVRRGGAHGAAEQRARRDDADAGDHRDRPDARKAGRHYAPAERAQRRSACGSPSMTSERAIARWPTCANSRSIHSRSIAPSSPVWSGVERDARADAHADPARQGTGPADACRGRRAPEPGPPAATRGMRPRQGSCSRARWPPRRSSASSKRASTKTVAPRSCRTADAWR